MPNYEIRMTAIATVYVENADDEKQAMDLAIQEVSADWQFNEAEANEITDPAHVEAVMRHADLVLSGE